MFGAGAPGLGRCREFSGYAFLLGVLLENWLSGFTYNKK
jgi:hypothetical protein